MLAQRLTTALRRVLDLVLIGLIAAVVGGVILARFVPITGRETLVITGRSMEPAILVGSAIVTEPVAIDSIAVGDIVTVGPPMGAAFTHRVSRIVDRADGRWFEMKGDANAAPDPALVDGRWIEGRSAVAVPFAGYLIALLTEPPGVLLLLSLGGILLAAIWLLETFEPDEEELVVVRATGEPMSARRLMERRDLGSRPFAPPVPGELGVSERIAGVQATRLKRERWRSSHRGRPASGSQPADTATG